MYIRRLRYNGYEWTFLHWPLFDLPWRFLLHVINMKSHHQTWFWCFSFSELRNVTCPSSCLHWHWTLRPWVLCIFRTGNATVRFALLNVDTFPFHAYYQDWTTLWGTRFYGNGSVYERSQWYKPRDLCKLPTATFGQSYWFFIITTFRNGFTSRTRRTRRSIIALCSLQDLL